jgi:hypothetical protein
MLLFKIWGIYDFLNTSKYELALNISLLVQVKGDMFKEY